MQLGLITPYMTTWKGIILGVKTRALHRLVFKETDLALTIAGKEQLN